MPTRGCSHKPSRTSPARNLRRSFSRYEWVRRVRKVSASPKRVFGALARHVGCGRCRHQRASGRRAERRFSSAEIALAGPRKSYELFANDSRIRHAHVEYRRGGLRERLAAAEELKALVDDPDCAR